MEHFPSDLYLKPWLGSRPHMQITSREILASDDNQNISTKLYTFHLSLRVNDIVHSLKFSSIFC